MSTLKVNTLDSYTGSTLNVDSTADLQIDSATSATSATTGALRVYGGISTQENLYVGGNAVINGTMTANGGTITLGDSAADNVAFGADLTSNIIPNANNTYDLGSSSQKWKDIYTSGTTYVSSIDLDSVAITDTATTSSIGTTATTIDSFSRTFYRSAKYLISIKDVTNSEYQTCEITLVHSGADSKISEYGIVYTGSARLATFTTEIDGASCLLKATGVSANNTVKLTRTLVAV